MKYPQYNGREINKKWKRSFGKEYKKICRIILEENRILGYNLNKKKLKILLYNYVAYRIFEKMKEFSKNKRKEKQK